MAITSFFGWAGIGSGAFFGGWFFDWQGTYVYSYGFAMAMGVVNIAILLAFSARVARRSAGVAAPVLAQNRQSN